MYRMPWGLLLFFFFIFVFFSFPPPALFCPVSSAPFACLLYKGNLVKSEMERSEPGVIANGE